MARPEPSRNAPPKKARPAAAEEGPGFLADWGPAVLVYVFLGVIILAMTPYTYNLDDIKKGLFFAFGGLLAAASMAWMALGMAPLPQRALGWGLAAYAAVLAVSTLLSEFRWVGVKFMIFNWASVGFFLGGLGVGAVWRRSRIFLAVAVSVAFAVSVFGFMQYDLLGSGRTFTMWMHDFLYGRSRGSNQTAMQALLYTFNSGTRRNLMSTILNRDFYAAYCLLYLPFCVTLALIARGWAGRAVGMASALFLLASIFLCKSKGEYVFALLEIALYVAVFALAIRKVGVGVRLRYVGAWLAGAAMLILTLLFLNLPSLMGQLKTLSFSVSSRRIIFTGGIKLFLDHPILGGGPGSFFIFFPRHRSPDYFEHEISNVTELSHNYILDILCETGVAGALAFAVFALPLAYYGFRTVFRAEDRRVRLLALACLCGLLGMFGSNMTSTSARWPIGATSLWTILGVLAGLARQAEGWTPAFGLADWARLGGGAAKGGDSQPAALQPLLRWAPAAAGLAAIIGLGVCANEGRAYWKASVAYNDGMTDFSRVTEYRMSDLMNPKLPQKDRDALKTMLTHAGAKFEEATQIYPQHLSAYYKLGSVHNFMANLQPAKEEERMREALQIYLKLMEYAPDYAEIHFNMGVLNLRLAQIAEQKLRKLPPNAADERKRLEAEQKTFEEARIKFFKLMRDMSIKPTVFLQLASSYLQASMFEQAQQVFREGLNLYEEKKAKEALKPINERKGYDGDLEIFAKGYHESSRSLNDPKGQVEALTALWKLHPFNPQLQFHLEALRIAADAGLDEEFDSLLALARERNPVDPKLFEIEARRASEKKDNARTLAAARNGVKLYAPPETAKIAGFAAGPNHDLLKRGADAAVALNDAESAKLFYAEIVKRNTAAKAEAEAWLAAHP